MARSQTVFHIQQAVRPEHIEHILGAVSSEEPFDAQSVCTRLSQQGYQITPGSARRNLDMGRKLGIFEKRGRSGHTLTPRGWACRTLAPYRREVYSDVMHYLFFAAWELSRHEQYWSWSYARTCEMLWRDRPAIRVRKKLFAQLSAEASKEFPNLAPVVGTETVYAVTNWLRELSPPFFILENGKLATIQEREWFSVELALLAVSYLYAVRGAAVQTPLLLDRNTVEPLCSLCLASVDCIMAMIETASRTFPVLDIHTGEWGSSVILRRTVSIPMLT